MIVLIKPPAIEVAEKHDAPDHPDISLGYLAGYLLAKKIPVKIIDSKLLRLTQEETLERLFSEPFDHVGLTSFTHEIVNVADMAAKIKKRAPNKKIIIGGVHATAIPKQTLEEFSAFDIAVVGEGEHILYELLKALEQKKPLSDVKGIAFRYHGTIIVNPPAVRPANLDELAFPAWQLSPRCKHYHIISSRGCPYQCVFCMSPYGRLKVRERSWENVIKELDWVVRTFRPKMITFNDETFGINKERAYKLLDAMYERGYYRLV